MSDSAHRLYSILERLRGGKKPLRTDWEETLDAQYGSAEFVRRYAEVLRLLADVSQLGAALPDAGTRNRIERYLHPWWHALVMPDHIWSSAHSVIGQGELDQLGSVADILEARLPAPPSDIESILRDLHLDCDEWITALEQATSMPASLRLSLIAQVRDVIWLIENANLFGTHRVQHEAQAMLGGLGAATGHAPDKGSWLKRLVASAGIIATLNGVVSAPYTAISVERDARAVLQHIIDGSATEPGAIEAPSRSTPAEGAAEPSRPE